MIRPAFIILMVLLAGALGFARAGNAGDSVTQEATTRELRAATRTEAPSGPIAFNYEFLDSPALNQSARVRITASWQLPFEYLQGSGFATEGLRISPEGFSLSGLASVRRAEKIITVTPLVEGSLRFSVTLEGEVGGQGHAGQLVVPVDMGSTQQDAEATGTLGVDENGESIIRLRAHQP